MINKILSTVGSKFLVTLLNFVIVVLTAKFMGANGRGQISLFVLNLTIVKMVNDFIGGSSLVFLVSRAKLSELIFPSYMWAILSAVFATIIIYLLNLENNIIHLFFLSLLLSLNSIHLTVLLGKEKITAHNVLSVGQVLLLLVGILWFYFLPNVEIKFIHYLYALYISFGIQFIFSLHQLLRLHWGNLAVFSFVRLKQLLTYGVYIQLGNIAQLFNYRLSYYLLDQFHADGKEQVGIYSVAIQLAEGLWIVSRSISMVQYSAIANSKDENYAIPLTVNLIKLNVVLMLMALAVITLIPASFYVFIFGVEFMQVKKIILCLAPGILAFSVSGSLSHYFSGIGKYPINTVSSSFGLVVTIVFAFLLIPKYGFFGAAFTASASYLVSTIYQLLIFIRQTKISWTTFLISLDDINQLKLQFTKSWQQFNK